MKRGRYPFAEDKSRMLLLAALLRDCECRDVSVKHADPERHLQRRRWAAQKASRSRKLMMEQRAQEPMHVEIDRDGDSFRLVVTGTPREVVLRSRDLSEIQKAGRVKAALLRIPLINKVEDRVQSVGRALILEEVR